MHMRHCLTSKPVSHVVTRPRRRPPAWPVMALCAGLAAAPPSSLHAANDGPAVIEDSLADDTRIDSPASRRVVDLDAVQVTVSTATRTERQLADVPVRTEVLRREDIVLRASLDFSQVAELINGLRVESNCQNCNTAEVQLLGLGGAYNQLLFDGMPLLSTLGSVYGLEQIPAAFIDRIEVVKGGGSSLYGAGAVAGVVNLIPQQPLHDGGFVQIGADVQQGQPTRHLQGRVDQVRADARLGWSLAAQSLDGDPIDFDGDGYTEVTARKQRVAGMQGWYALDDATTLRAHYVFTHERRRGGNRLDQPEHLANIAESLTTDFHRGGLRWDRILNDDVDVSLGYAFAYIRRNSYYGGLGDITTDPDEPTYDPGQLDPSIPGSAAAVAFNQYGTTENPLHYLDSQLNWQYGAHALALGLQYKRESVRDQNRDADGRGIGPRNDETFSNIGAFVQDEWALDDALDLVLGARVDKSSSIARAIVSPRLALAFRSSARATWRAGLSSGFRAPDVFSEDLHVETLGAAPVRIVNADGLSEERATTAMLGLDWRSDPAEPRWTFDASASVTRLRDTFVVGELRSPGQGEPYAGTLIRVRDNAGGSRVAGIEANLGWKPRRTLALSAGAAWYRARHDRAQTVYDDTGEDDGGDTVIALRDFLKTPRWTGVGQLTWTPVEDWSSYVGYRYTGPMWALNQNQARLQHTRAFHVIDLGATRHIHLDNGREWDLSFGIRNLLDQRQRDLESGASRDSDYVYGPRFARTWHASLRYVF